MRSIPGRSAAAASRIEALSQPPLLLDGSASGVRVPVTAPPSQAVSGESIARAGDESEITF